MATLSQPTLDRLILEARIFLNQPDSTNSFWSDQELTIYANDAIRQYFLTLTKYAEGQFDPTPVQLNLVAGVETVAMPSDFFQVRAIYRVTNNGNQVMHYNNNLTEGYYSSTGAQGDAYVPSYYFRGNSIVLRPIPTANETAGLLLEYTAFPDTIITGQDAMTSGISPIFKELVVKYMCYQAKLKESSVMGGNTYAAVERHLADLYNIFKETVGGRSKYPQFTVPFNP